MRTHYDVAVVGGGTSGVIAAIQAGRAGARTLVVEKYGICWKRIKPGSAAARPEASPYLQ